MNTKDMPAADLQAIGLANKQEIKTVMRRAAAWGWWLPLLLCLLFALLYVGLSLWQYNSLELAASNLDGELKGAFAPYRWSLGLILGLVSALATYILYGLSWLLGLWHRRSWRIILAAGAYGPWLYLASKLLAGAYPAEPWVQVLTVYTAAPLWTASMMVLVLNLLWLLSRWLGQTWLRRGTKIAT